MTHLPRCLLWLPLFAALSGCAGGHPIAPAPLWGSDWRLLELGGQAVMAQPAASLAFPQPGQAAGHGSCNRFFGSVEIDRDRIRFGPLGATKMACLGGVGEQEARYLGALQKAQRYEAQGDTLLIHAEGMDRPLRFTRSAPQR